MLISKDKRSENKVSILFRLASREQRAAHTPQQERGERVSILSRPSSREQPAKLAEVLTCEESFNPLPTLEPGATASHGSCELRFAPIVSILSRPASREQQQADRTTDLRVAMVSILSRPASREQHALEAWAAKLTGVSILSRPASREQLEE